LQGDATDSTRHASEINVGLSRAILRLLLESIMDVDSQPRPQPMTTNTSAGNVIEILSSPVGPAQKRKCEDRVRHEGKENGDGDKRVKLDGKCDLSVSRAA
jgi:hypothetical protein